MTWHFDNDRPIYTQLLEQILFLIVSGQYPPGSKLPSVRDLASEASVNPNTMQRALTELERSGLIYSQRTSGRFVTEDKAMIQKMKDTIGKDKILALFKDMEQLGYDSDQTISLIHKIIDSEKAGGNV